MEILIASGALVLAIVVAGVLRRRLGIGEQPAHKHYPNSTVDREMARSQLHGNDFTDFPG